jgi:hypothetical protein
VSMFLVNIVEPAATTPCWGYRYKERWLSLRIWSGSCSSMASISSLKAFSSNARVSGTQRAPYPQTGQKALKMARTRRRAIVCKKVYYDFLEDLGFEDPYCWECTSHKARTHRGYIQCNRDGFRFLHQWVYWDRTGEIPPVLLMACGNRICLNPAHMQPMTVEEAKKASLPGGCGHPPDAYGHMVRRTLTPEKLAKVRELLAEGHSAIAIGRHLGIGYRMVEGIASGALYRHE